jgi:hypothetical protein
MFFTTKAGIAMLIIGFALNMAGFAVLNIVQGDNLAAIGEVVIGLIALYFLPRRI